MAGIPKGEDPRQPSHNNELKEPTNGIERPIARLRNHVPRRGMNNREGVDKEMKLTSGG